MSIAILSSVIYLILLSIADTADSSVKLSCPDSFCLSKPSRCTCSVTAGLLIKWTVHYPNMSVAGHITHDIANSVNDQVREQYLLNGTSWFASILIEETNGNVSAILEFTPLANLKNYIIQCRGDNNSRVAQKEIEFHSIPLSPRNIYSSNFTSTTFFLSWDSPTNHSCVEKYAINSTINGALSPLVTSATNVTLTTAVNSPFLVKVAGVDYSETKGKYSNGTCIQLTKPEIVTELRVYPDEEVIVFFDFPTSNCNPKVSSHQLVTNISKANDSIYILPSPTSVTALSGATQGSTYTIQLAASNEIGLGPVTITTFAIPVYETPAEILSSSFLFSEDLVPSCSCGPVGSGTRTVINPLSAGLLALGFIGGLMSSLSVIYLCYCVTELRKAKKADEFQSLEQQDED